MSVSLACLPAGGGRFPVLACVAAAPPCIEKKGVEAGRERERERERERAQDDMNRKVIRFAVSEAGL
jgi:hypothetical protein